MQSVAGARTRLGFHFAQSLSDVPVQNLRPFHPRVFNRRHYMLSGGIDAAVAQVDNRFAYLCEELHSSLCPYYLLMLDIAALDFPIQVGKDHSEVVLIAANRLRHDLHRRRRILLQGVFQLFSDTLSLKALAFRQPLNQSRAKLREAAAQKMGVVTDTASQFL